MEVILIIGLVVLLAVSEFNPVIAVRKLWAAFSFGVGATPKATELAKAKVSQWTAEAKEAEAREGKVFERVGSSFRQQGKTWSEQELNPIIEQATKAESDAKAALERMLKK